MKEIESDSKTVLMTYGNAGQLACEIDASRIVAACLAPPAMDDLAEKLQRALEHPLEFPPFVQLFTPGDRVVLALDRHTPQAPVVIAEIWKILQQRDVEASMVTILQPAGFDGVQLKDPRTALPEEARAQFQWVIHDPTDGTQQAYLATTASGERIYLSRALVEADVAVSVGVMGYDSLIGFRGTSSVFYPGLSSIEAIKRAHGLGHSELGPDDERPLRQTIDEIAWLLGTQFSIQVVPGAGDDVVDVLAGATEAVFRRGKELLTEHWMVQLKNRVPLVIAAVDADSAGHGWLQVCAALSTARNLVTKGGKIVILSELNAELGDGMKLITESRDPVDALQPLRRQAPPDLIPATQLASTVDWAHVYLLSKLDGNLVENLFMTPLDNEKEVQRLIKGDDRCVLLGSAQRAFGTVQRTEL